MPLGDPVTSGNLKCPCETFAAEFLLLFTGKPHSPAVILYQLQEDKQEKGLQNHKVFVTDLAAFKALRQKYRVIYRLSL